MIATVCLIVIVRILVLASVFAIGSISTPATEFVILIIVIIYIALTILRLNSRALTTGRRSVVCICSDSVSE